MLTEQQTEAYKRDGYLKVEALFTPQEVAKLESEMDWIIDEWWGDKSIGWRGPWRDDYLPEKERYNTKAVFIGNPQFYSAAWGRVIFHKRLVGCVQSLVGPDVQWHHTILLGKPPELGTPFPCIKTSRFIRMTDKTSSIALFIWMIRRFKAVAFVSLSAATSKDRWNILQMNTLDPIFR